MMSYLTTTLAMMTWTAKIPLSAELLKLEWRYRDATTKDAALSLSQSLSDLGKKENSSSAMINKIAMISS